MRRLLIALFVLMPVSVFAQTPTVQQRVDVALGIGSLSMASVAAGLTTACVATNDCRELNPVMAKLLGSGGPVRMLTVKALVGGATHYGVWRFTSGKTRTLLLAAMLAINTLDAVHDIRVTRDIERARSVSFSMMF